NWIIDTHQESSVINLVSNDSKKLNYSIKKKIVDNFIYFYILDLTQYKNVFLMYDPLTHLLTRDSIINVISHDLSDPSQKPFSLIYLDIDNFKLLNDLYGHQVGDKILKIVGEKLKERFVDAKISRLGGDEFLIVNYGPIKYDIIHEYLHQTINKVDEIFKDDDIPVPLVFGKDSVQDDKTFRITFTAGVSRFPIDGTTYDELLLKADKALHRGKMKGKRCYIIYLDDMHKDITLNGSYGVDDSRANLAFKRFYISLLDILNGELSIRQKVSKYLKLSCEYMGLDRIIICKKNENELSYYQGYANQVKEAALEYLEQNIKGYNIFGSLSDKTVVVNSTAHMKDQVMKELTQRHNVKSFIMVPLKYENHILGYMRFDSVTLERKFSIGEEVVAKTVTKIMTLFLHNLNKNEFAYLNQNYDKVTDTYTYDYFTYKVEEKLYSSLNKYYIGVFNIRNFKIYNELYGYDFGNKILKDVAKTIQKVYTNSIIGRLRDDHLIIFGYYNSSDDLRNSFEQAIKILRETKTPGSNLLYLQEGFYVLNKNTENLSDSIDKARLALNNINNNLVQEILEFKEEMMIKEINEKKLTAHFAEALLNHEFKLYLQPKFNSITNKLIGAEALTRWNYLNKELLTPADYIEVLEYNKLIGALDTYVFEDVCKYIRFRIDNKLELFPISVNLSKIQVETTNYIDLLEDIRKKYNVDASLIIIEITESIYVKNFEQVSNSSLLNSSRLE
ncbi:MAG: diguanylate cyclase, partial [Acholeplasmatales bacterium]|nr:diguanylate cyclase [Acholeplasmatales bacterium]